MKVVIFFFTTQRLYEGCHWSSDCFADFFTYVLLMFLCVWIIYYIANISENFILGRLGDQKIQHNELIYLQ